MLHRDINSKAPKHIRWHIPPERIFCGEWYKPNKASQESKRLPKNYERLNHKIADIFRRESIPVRIAHGSHTLGHRWAYMHQGQLPHLSISQLICTSSSTRSHPHMPNQTLKRHWNQDLHTRKRPRKFTTIRGILHKETQTYPQLTREM